MITMGWRGSVLYAVIISVLFPGLIFVQNFFAAIILSDLKKVSKNLTAAISAFIRKLEVNYTLMNTIQILMHSQRSTELKIA